MVIVDDLHVLTIANVLEEIILLFGVFLSFGGDGMSSHIVSSLSHSEESE